MEEGATFAQWLAQGGGYAAVLAGAAGTATVLCGAAYKLYRAASRPFRDAARRSEEGDRALHERVDGLEGRCGECDERFANDFASIKMLTREVARQAQSNAMLTEGIYLIIQHLVTDDHVQDMEAWMREHAKMAASAHLETTGKEKH